MERRRPEDLGQMVSHHTVNRQRRFVIVALGVVVGSVFLFCGNVLPHPVRYTPSDGRVRGTVLGIGVCALMIAAWYLFRALRDGRGEYFEVRERGLVHGTARRVEAWRWSDIDGVREIYLPETAIRTYLGAQYVLRIRLTDGRRFSVTGLTEMYPNLGEALVTNCQFLPDAPGPRWLWATQAVAGFGTFGFCLFYALSHPGAFNLLMIGILAGLPVGLSGLLMLIRAVRLS